MVFNNPWSWWVAFTAGLIGSGTRQFQTSSSQVVVVWRAVTGISSPTSTPALEPPTNTMEACMCGGSANEFEALFE